jgi:imidazolonepropionase-like amidohydrolase
MQRSRFHVGLVTALWCLVHCVDAQNPIAPQLPTEQRPLLIEGISIIDVLSGAERRGQSVLIEHGHIIAISDGSGSSAAQTANKIDGRGKYLIPGLWDAHVHITEETGRFLPLYLRFGMTSVIDKGGSLDRLISLRETLASGREIGPRLFMAGRPIDGDPPQWPSAYPDVPLVVRTAVEARTAVRTNKQAGANYIKLYGGLGQEAMSAAIDEAHKLGMKATGDLLLWPFAPEVALKMRIDALEHGVPTAFKTGAPGRYSYPAEESRLLPLIQTMISQHTALTSTIAHLVRVTANPQEKATFQALPPQLQKRALEMLALQTLSPASAALRRDYHCGVVSRFVEGGGLVMAGTDSFWLTSYPGDVHEEMQQLVDCGLTPLQAIQAATINPAQWLGASDLGTVKLGNRADLLILNANPLTSIQNTRQIYGVVLEGRYLDRTALEALSGLAVQPIPRF